MTTIPILVNHDPEKVLGYYENGVVTFKPGTVTAEWVPLGFGYRVLEMEEADGVVYLLKIQVLEISTDPKAEEK